MLKSFFLILIFVLFFPHKIIFPEFNRRRNVIFLFISYYFIQKILNIVILKCETQSKCNIQASQTDPKEEVENTKELEEFYEKRVNIIKEMKKKKINLGIVAQI